MLKFRFLVGHILHGDVLDRFFLAVEAVVLVQNRNGPTLFEFFLENPVAADFTINDLFAHEPHSITVKGGPESMSFADRIPCFFLSGSGSIRS